MFKDIISHNNKSYQLTTIKNEDTGIFDTTISEINSDKTLGKELYRFTTTNSGKSMEKHRDIYYNPQRYLSDEAITEYLEKCKESTNMSVEEFVKAKTEEMVQMYKDKFASTGSPMSERDEIFFRNGIATGIQVSSLSLLQIDCKGILDPKSNPLD